MFRKRSREEVPKLSEHTIKFAAVRASPAIVSIVTHNVPVEMSVNLRGYMKMTTPPKEYIFFACGMIIECQSSANGHYLCTVLAPASLFQRTDDVMLDDIEIDVFASTGVLCKGKLLACDFHYNLAAISIESHSPLQTVTFKPIDDTLSIDPTHQRGEKTFQLRPHSDLFKIVPGSQIVSVWRSHAHPYGLYSGSGTLWSRSPKGFSCNELYEITNISGHNGAPVLNSFGEIIGIIFCTSTFLSSNTVSRWWDHYKSFGQFRRPFLGMEVANLHETDLDFLSKFVTTFPGISTAVVVTKVNEDSPASHSGICTNDVIVKLDGKLVQSKLKFYELIWEKAGTYVDFNVLRVTDGKELNLSLVIEEASPNKFHQWPHPHWKMVW